MQTRETRFGHVLALEPGEDLIESLRQFAGQHDVPGGFLTGLGSVDRLDLGYFDPDRQEYLHHDIAEPLEVASLTGSLAWLGDEAQVHVHGLFGRRDGSALGGHVFRAVCSVTMEIAVFTMQSRLERGAVDYTHLQLLRPEASR